MNTSTGRICWSIRCARRPTPIGSHSGTLFTEKQLDSEFAGSPQYEDLKARNKLGDIIKWTEEAAAKSPVGGGAAMKTAEKFGGHVKKAMIWEIWSSRTREIIWFIREVSGIVLRVDPDSLGLTGFYPIPVPMLAIRTSDTRIPRAFFDLYARLAADLDETSRAHLRADQADQNQGRLQQRLERDRRDPARRRRQNDPGRRRRHAFRGLAKPHLDGARSMYG